MATPSTRRRRCTTRAGAVPCLPSLCSGCCVSWSCCARAGCLGAGGRHGQRDSACHERGRGRIAVYRPCTTAGEAQAPLRTPAHAAPERQDGERHRLRTVVVKPSPSDTGGRGICGPGHPANVARCALMSSHDEANQQLISQLRAELDGRAGEIGLCTTPANHRDMPLHPPEQAPGLASTVPMDAEP